MGNLIKSVVFTVVCAVVIALLGTLLQPKRRVETAVDNYHSEHNGLYELERDTLDVLFLGSSHSFSSVSPEDIYKQYGITGYVQASSCQKLWQSYYYLIETLQTQKPKVVILDTFMALNPEPQSEPFNREAIDCMKLSIAKLKSAWRAERMAPADEDLYSYIIPAFRYHDRWEELSEQDYRYFVMPGTSSAKGFLPRQGSGYAEFNASDYDESYSEVGEIDSLCAAYLSKIKGLCEENGIDFILVKYPTCLWNGYNAAVIHRWADENGVLYMDFNADTALREQADIDWSVDSLDGGNHLNYDGAMKMTEWMGQWLADHYSFADKRNDDRYAVWDKDYEYYKKCVVDARMPEQTDFAAYVDLLRDGDYVCVVTVYGIDMRSWEDARQRLHSLGMSDGCLDNTLDMANVCILNNGEAAFEGYDSGRVAYRGSVRGFDMSVSNERTADGQVFSLAYDRQEWGDNQPGCQFIVFDPLTGKHIDSSVWLVGTTGEFSRV